MVGIHTELFNFGNIVNKHNENKVPVKTAAFLKLTQVVLPIFYISKYNWVLQ